MPAHTDVLDQGRDRFRIWAGMTGLSLLCHILFFSGVLFLPELQSARSYIHSAVEVDLVSLPPAAVKGVPAKPAKGPEAAKQPQALGTKVADPPKKPVSVLPIPLQVKKFLKKKTYNASKAIKSAIARIEKEASKSRPRSVQQAIDKLKDEVEAGDVVMRTGTGTGVVGKKTVELLDIYNAEIWHRIQKNWAFSKEMARGRTDLEAIIIVKVMKKGDLRDVWFEKRSGNAYFDDSVSKAIRKSDPLPPLPEGYLNPFYEVGIRFNLSELQRRF